ncbi:MAG: ChaN family lipoprotein [Bacteriovoracia bacterium]
MNPHRRLVRLQRQILLSIRADVRKALGDQSKDILSYYKSYKREFSGSYRSSSKEELVKECLEADIILIGDYHTFARAQDAALQLTADLFNSEQDLALGLEAFRTENQELINSFLKKEIAEKDFLSKINYGKTWGFPWEQFKKFLLFAQENNVPLLGLNVQHENLLFRDQHAARTITDFVGANPTRKLIVLYGDLHLASNHLPKFIEANLKEKQLKKNICVIFQNAESIYWKLADRKAESTVDVVCLEKSKGKKRYCIFNTTPWVKLQSFLTWTENQQLFSTNTEDNDEDDLALSGRYDDARVLFTKLSHALGLQQLTIPNFEIVDINEQSISSWIYRSETLKTFNRIEQQYIKYHVYLNRPCFVPVPNGTSLLVLPTNSPNALIDGVSYLLHHASCPSPILDGSKGNEREFFFSAVIRSALSFFASKLLNHNRKCDLEDDYRIYAEKRLQRDSLPKEKLQRKTALVILKHLNAQRDFLKGHAYRAPLSFRGLGRTSLFIEVTRGLGNILGEKLYTSFLQGNLPLEYFQKLYRSRLFGYEKNRKLYLQTVRILSDVHLSHSSYQDRF